MPNIDLIFSKVFQKIKSVKYHSTSLFILLLITIGVIYSFIAITLHNRFMTFGLDLGYFDEAIWKISQGKFPYSGVGCIWLLEDHFQPILYLIAPLFKLWDNVRILLIFQSFIMVFAALPLYLLAKKLTTRPFSFAVSFAYLFFIGTQFAILNEFHQVTIAPLFIALTFYALNNKRLDVYLLSIFALFLIKEELSLLIAAIGLGLLFSGKYKRLGLITFIFGTLAFLFLLYIFMPFISIKEIYAHMDFGSAGFTPKDILLKVFTDPAFFITSMLYPEIKLKTLFQSFFSFGFVPLFSPFAYLIPLAEDFIARFIYAGPQYTKWGLVNHHAAVSAMLLSITAVYGAARLSYIVRHKIQAPTFYSYIGLLIIFSTLLNNLFFHGPVNSILKKSFYGNEEWTRNTKDVIAHVPNDASLASQNNLLPHLTHRDSIYRIPFGLNSDYMVVDMHDGPNQYAPLNYEEMKQFIHELLISGRYSVIYQKGEAMLLKRNFKTDITKSKFYSGTAYCYYSYEER